MRGKEFKKGLPTEEMVLENNNNGRKLCSSLGCD
jgi:hypothetical protein